MSHLHPFEAVIDRLNARLDHPDVKDSPFQDKLIRYKMMELRARILMAEASTMMASIPAPRSNAVTMKLEDMLARASVTLNYSLNNRILTLEQYTPPSWSTEQLDRKRSSLINRSFRLDEQCRKLTEQLDGSRQ